MSAAREQRRIGAMITEVLRRQVHALGAADDAGCPACGYWLACDYDDMVARCHACGWHATADELARRGDTL